jgi:hypothetical protein
MTSQSLVATFSHGDAIQYRGHGDAEISMRKSRLRGGLRRHDRRLAEGEEPAVGSHLVTPRFGFAHHGIYLGGGRVIHYGAFVHELHRGPVEEVSLARFTHGHTLWVRPGVVHFDGKEVIRRARSRIGENSYRLLSNNCEHFCEWCLRGEHRSEQVERALGLPRRFARSVSAATVALLAVLPLRVSGADAPRILTKRRASSQPDLSFLARA